jgi:hypothetical protein
MMNVLTQITARMTVYQLTQVLAARANHQVALPDGRRGYLRSIEREDGSGRSFNLYVNVGNGKTESIHVRTID